MLRRALSRWTCATARRNAAAPACALAARARVVATAPRVTAARAAARAVHTAAVSRGTPSDVGKESAAAAAAAAAAKPAAAGGGGGGSVARATRGSLFFTPATNPYERRAASRGVSDIGWLRAKYSFSFSPMYKDNAHRGFRQLRVLNDDTVMALGGFDTHPHQNMEIVTYVLSGAIEHEDTLRNKAVIQAGEVQRMTAGRGIQHSEYNRSKHTPVHLLQIWLHPHDTGLAPSYQQSCFSEDEKRSSLRLIASPDGADGSIVVNSDARLYAALLGAFGQTTVTHTVPAGRHVYVHIARGDVTITWSATDAAPGTAHTATGQYGTGDGLGLSWPAVGAGRTVTITHRPDPAAPNAEAEFVLFDLP